MKFEANSKYFENNAFNEDDVNIFFGSYETFKSNNLEISPSTADYYELQICLDGNYDVYTNDRKFSISKGSLWVTAPYMHIRKELISETASNIYILIKGPTLHQYFAALGFNDENVLFPHPVSDKCIGIVEKIIKLLSSYTVVSYTTSLEMQSFKHFRNSKNTTARRMERRGLFYILLSELFDLHETNSKTEDSVHNKKEYIRKATKYIEANCGTNLNVDNVAASLNLNRSYLYRIFKSELGISVQDFIIQTRIRVSCSLLKNTNFSIKSVALSVNYDPITFSRIFKQHIGMTPLQYRKQHTNSEQ